MDCPVRVIADDLTGAADAGVTLLAGRPSVVVTLGIGGGQWGDGEFPALSADTATRDADAEVAAQAVADLAGALPDRAELVDKVDSALRGHVAPQVAALRDVLPDHLVVLAPAFPRNGRVTRGGVQHVGGVPVHLGEAWAAEARRPPESLAALLAPMPSGSIHLGVVRGTATSLARSLEDALRRHLIAICDAETDRDLDRIVAAARHAELPVAWVGAAGLAGAVGRAGGDQDAVGRAGGDHDAGWVAPAGPVRRLGAYLAVVGSTAAASAAQAAVLANEGGARWVELPVEALTTAHAGALDALAEEVLRSVESADTVVTISGPLESEVAGVINESLATVTAPAVARAGALLLTGGATARAVLDACGTVALRLVAELDPGIVLAQPLERATLPVVTKSGAFGDERTMLRALQRITLEEGSIGRDT